MGSIEADLCDLGLYLVNERQVAGVCVIRPMRYHARKLQRLPRTGRAGDKRAEEAGNHERSPRLDSFEMMLEVAANGTGRLGNLAADGMSEKESSRLTRMALRSDRECS